RLRSLHAGFWAGERVIESVSRLLCQQTRHVESNRQAITKRSVTVLARYQSRSSAASAIRCVRK
ncbi:hypothetical protein CYG45_01245, partial [Lacticaseibacillus rhamnosus]